ncbi:aminotransferase class I/II-fold pyridoxal phosphate-dependent enzyme [Leuconostocaceae bacterium ESL0958]|nr:aminotransferase class I/II-fold pyridoxal phosphate-dependent enzyme [Leuconostocaceae bacterium ESL0958]
MTSQLPELNPTVLNMHQDALINFQKEVMGIADLLPLTFGEPGFATPTVVKEATIQAIQNDRSHYGSSQGELPLRRAILSFLKDRYGITGRSIDEVVVTTGVSEAINVVLKTLLAAGDGLLIPDPAFGSYFAAIDLANAVALPIDTSRANYKLTPALVDEAMAQAKRPVKAILFNYPNNPTGVTYTEAELAALAATFKRHQLWVISDEIYAELTYGQDHHSLALDLPEQTLVVNGLSKSHAMTGYRVGFILGPKAIMQKVQEVHVSLTYGVPTFIQDGAAVAFAMPKEDLAYMKEAYEARRQLAVDTLTDLGFDIVYPKGAFYLFAKIPADFGTDGWAFAADLAQQGRVAIMPGAGFSLFDGAKAYVRLSYAADMAQLQEGLQRIRAYVEKKRANR